MEKPANHPYQLRVNTVFDAEFISSYFPAGTVLHVEAGTSLISNICTDQSGMMGLLRILHNLGCAILEMKVENATHAHNEGWTEGNE